MFARTRHIPWQDARKSIAGKLSRLPESLCDYSYPLYLGVTAAIAMTGVIFMTMFPVIPVVAVIAVSASVTGNSQEYGAWQTAAILVAGALAAWATAVVVQTRSTLKPGRQLSEGEAPVLFEIVGRFRELYGAPSIGATVVTDDCAIEIKRIARAGMPLLFRNRLEIGLPLLLSLSPLQFEGMLAGRIGQLSGRYNRVTAWLATQYAAWSDWQANVRGVKLPHYMLRAFTSWFIPLYAWVSRPAVRRHNLEFDRCAHDVLSVQDQADLIATLIVVSRFLEEHYWPTILKSSDRVPEPGFLPYANLEHVLKHKLREEDVQRWLRSAGAVIDNGVSRIPSLRARLDLIGQERIGWPDLAGEKAIYRFLESYSDEIIVDRDRTWVDSIRDEWQARFERSQRDRNRLRALEMKLSRTPLHGKDAIAYAALTKRLCDRHQAIEAHKKIVEANPTNARINYGAGKYLVSVGESIGVKALERAMELDKQYVDSACRLISDFVVNNCHQAALRNYVSSTAKAG
jgi:hypothetical protein